MKSESDGSEIETGVSPVLEGFASRLEQLRNNYGMGQRKFSEWLKLPPTTYHEYERRKRKPLLDAIVQVIERTGVSADWLLKGRGPMFPPQSAHAVIREIREASGLNPKDVAAAAGMPVERFLAFESGSEIPDLTADFQALAEGLRLDPVSRQRLFDAVERDFRPVYFSNLVREETAGGEASEPSPKTARFGKFLEPWQLRKLLDADEEAFRLYMAQPLAKKASLVMYILRNGIDDQAAIKKMIYDNFSEIKILEQVKALLNSKHREELVSFIKFLLHRAENPEL